MTGRSRLNRPRDVLRPVTTRRVVAAILPSRPPECGRPCGASSLVSGASSRENPMTRHIRNAALITLLSLAGGLLLTARPAQAQGPYGRNSYEDWPFNQGSLFYRPL